MSRTLGQQIIIEAKPGAGSSLAAESVARSPADGYTLFIGTSSNVTNAAAGVAELRFDFVRLRADHAAHRLAADPAVTFLSVSASRADRSPARRSPAAPVRPHTVRIYRPDCCRCAPDKLVHALQGQPAAGERSARRRVSLSLVVASAVMPSFPLFQSVRTSPRHSTIAEVAVRASKYRAVRSVGKPARPARG
jgi:hypothetical protein